MEEVSRRLGDLARFSPENLVHFVDILVVGFLLYRVLILIRNARAWKIFVGIVMFVLALFLSDALHLRTLHWILDKAAALGPVALVILLLPELRQALEEFGRIGLLPGRLGADTGISIRTVDDIVASCGEMSSQCIGAIIVIERTNSLQGIADNGIPIHADLTAALLTTLFYKGSPLHDGAVIVQGDRIAAGGCRLPLSENERIGKQYHMRHRAALGIAEATDCVAIIVSEERGSLSVAVDGAIIHCDSRSELKEKLMEELGLKEKKSRQFGRKSRRIKTEEIPEAVKETQDVTR